MAQASPDDLFSLEIGLTEANLDLDQLIAAATADIERADILGVDLGPDVALLDNRLEDRAATVAARIELIMDRRATLQDRATKAGADTAAIRAELDALQEKMYGTTSTLRTMVDLMNQRGLVTADYERLLLESTGDLGTSVLDPEVMGRFPLGEGYEVPA